MEAADAEIMNLESEKEIILQLKPELEYWKEKSELLEVELRASIEAQNRMANGMLWVGILSGGAGLVVGGSIGLFMLIMTWLNLPVIQADANTCNLFD